MASLTLRKGTMKELVFGEIDVRGDRLMKRDSHRALKALRTKYADLFALLEEKNDDGELVDATVRNRKFVDHDDYIDYRADAQEEGYTIPAMRAAWAVEGATPPSLDDLQASFKSEVHACLVEIVRRNPDLSEDFPEAAAEVEKSDPNAPPSA